MFSKFLTKSIFILACCLTLVGCHKATYDLPTVEKAIAEDVNATEISLTETANGFKGTFVDGEGEKFDVEVIVSDEGKKMSWTGKSPAGTERTGSGAFEENISYSMTSKSRAN